MVIVDPCIDDDLALLVITEKQSVLLEEFGAEPVLVFITQSGALAILRSSWILGYDLESKFGDGGKLFGSVLSGVACRIFPAQALYLLQEGLQLLKKKRVGEDGPAIDDQWFTGNQA